MPPWPPAPSPVSDQADGCVGYEYDRARTLHVLGRTDEEVYEDAEAWFGFLQVGAGGNGAMARTDPQHRKPDALHSATFKGWGLG